MPRNSQILVLLIDNDSEQTVKSVLNSYQKFSFSFFYYCQPRYGVSRARNMGMEKMLADDGDMILFVDDDMRLPPEYLRILIDAMEKRNADAARGKMKLVYEDWQVRPSRRASLFSRRDIFPGNGVLVVASIFRYHNLNFDERFMFGYEDADFFCRAHLCGALLFLLEHSYFFEYCHELYFFGACCKIEKKDELKYYMEARQERTTIRKYRGG